MITENNTSGVKGLPNRYLYTARFCAIKLLMSLGLGRQPLGTTKEASQVTAATVRHCLERGLRAGVAQYASPAVDEPGWAWLTRKGLRLAGLEYPKWELGLSYLEHLFACNQARLWVEAHEPEAWWRSERTLRSELGWTGTGGQRGHRPTAEIVFDTHTCAVEVATVLKNPLHMREALPDLVARYAGGCWYFVSPRARSRLERLLTELEPAVQAQVRLLELAAVRQEASPGRHTRAPRLGVGQPGERLVAFRRQQEALEVAPKTVALIELTKEGVELVSIGLQGRRGRRDEALVGHSASLLSFLLPPGLLRCQQTTGSIGNPPGVKSAAGTHMPSLIPL